MVNIDPNLKEKLSPLSPDDTPPVVGACVVLSAIFVIIVTLIIVFWAIFLTQ